MPRISCVVATARNRVIGRAGTIPWRLPEDLKHFKRVTLGHPVIMGRKTFESILSALGKPLTGRENIVVTRAADYSPAGVRVAHSLEEALAAAGNAAEICVIGGAEIYALALPLAQRLYCTEIHADFEGDTFFPALETSQWTVSSREPCTSADGLRYDFVVYDRRNGNDVPGGQ